MADPVLPLIEAICDATIKLRSREGQSIGTVHAFMVDKVSGRATHAVLSLGGFLGMGKSFYPIPFEALAYDAAHDGYAVTVDRKMLEGGPSWANNAPAFDQAYADRVAGYYGVTAAPIAPGPIVTG
jgi:hypothetical protein